MSIASNANVENMTIEGFFLADYIRQRELVDELTAKVAELERQIGETENNYGVTDRHKPITMVQYNVIGSWSIATEKSLTDEMLRELVALDDDTLYEKALKTKCGSYSKLITRQENKYQYTLFVKESRTSYVAYFDKPNNYIKKVNMEPMCDDECPIEYDTDARQMAIDVLRENIQDAIERRESK